MVLNKNSWHYKFIDWMQQEHPSNLCPYVRTLLYCILAGVSVSLFLTVFAVAAILLLVMYPLFVFGVPPNQIILAAVSGAVWAGLLYALVTEVLFKKQLDKYKSREPQEPNIFVEYNKAKHDKICPQLTFKD